MPDSISDSISTTGRVTVGSSVTGEIETANDRDAYAVELVAGRTYRIDLEGAATGKGTLADPFLRWLRDSSGNGLHDTRDDNGGEGLNARQVFTPQVSGTYYISARGKGASTGTYTLSAIEVGDPPAFGQQGYAFDLAENTDGSTNRVSLGTVSATDPESATVMYSIAGGNESGLFEIDLASGELFYKGSGEDFESGTTSYDLTVRASDGQLTTDITVTVNVTDVSEAPTFGQQGYTFELAENTDGSTDRVSLGTVSATDPESATLSYSLVGGNESGSFEIDEATGELFYKGSGEDYESDATSYDLTVRASDGSLHADATVTVNVTDVVEAPAETPQQQVVQQSVSEPDGEDFPVNTSTAGRVAVGGSVTGNIGSNGDRDWFAVELVAGRKYQIDLRGSRTGDGTLFDPYFRGIYDADGNFFTDTDDDDGGVGLNSRVTFTLTAGGTYYIAAGAYSGKGTYEMAVTDTTTGTTVEDVFAASTETMGTVEVGGTATGNIETSGDHDWFAVELVEGKTYTIDLRGSSTDDGTLHNPYLRGIYDAEGNLISGTSDNDGGEGYNSWLIFTAAASGTYYIAAAGSYSRTGTYTGSYEVEVTEEEDIEVGVSATGEIETAGDRDVFAVELEAGKTYRFDLEGAWTSKGTLNDPQLWGLYDATGAQIDGTSDRDGGVYLNAQLYFTATTSGTYYVAARANGYLIGGYTLSVVETAEDVAADTGTTATVAVGGTATGEIESRDDRDWFAVTLEAGKTYRFDLEGDASGNSGKGTLSDPYLRGLHDATGALIDGTTDNDGGDAKDSRLNFTVATGGVYYVAVGANHMTYYEDTGSYALSVTDITEDVAADTGTTAMVAVGGAVTEDIETIGDRDWFAVTLEAGKTYRFDLEGFYTDKGTLTNPYLRGVYDATGTRIYGMTNGGGIGYNSHRYFTAAANGTYYVAAGAKHGPWVGSYTLAVTELAADVAADTGTTATVAVGGTVTGDIETLGDRDWFAVALEAGKTYRIDLEGTPTDKGTLRQPYLRGVYDATGDLIDGTTDDNGGWINNSRVYFTAPASGTYYVAASSAFDSAYAPGFGYKGSAGTYTLSVTELAADVTADTGTTATVAVGGTATGEIDFSGDRDWFAVTLEAGKTYQVDLEGLWPGGSAPSKGTLAHPHLRGIHDATGVLIDGTTDEHSGRGNGSQVYFTAATSGTYYVAASEHYGNRTGTYALTVTELADDFFANTSTTGTVAVGGTATGEIDFSGDRDWFAVTLEAGKTYRFDLEGESTDKGTLQDPYLRGIHDGTGALIDGTMDDDSHRQNSRVEFTAAASGTYYAAAGAFGDLTGIYTLAVEEVDGI